jgi:aspartyl-tRNA(Asn)/glutamyl-tRNA(Gln) amidotransferase subunit C
MKIDEETISKVADLARIEIKATEVDGLITELSKILTFMEKLNELDTTHVDPLVYMNQDVNVWRDDEVIQEISVEDGLKNSALHNEHFFMVPKIIEKQDGV